MLSAQLNFFLLLLLGKYFSLNNKHHVSPDFKCVPLQLQIGGHHSDKVFLLVPQCD